MKLRLHNNSIRFRLTQGEVGRLRDGGRLQETVRFGVQPDECLLYALEPAAAESQLRASMKGGAIVVHLPASLVRSWADGAQVGIEAEQPAGPESALRILIEKDFKCLHPADPLENADTFPNPAAGV